MLAPYAVCDNLIMLKPEKLSHQGDRRVALVTRGARGIGLEIVRRFLVDGCRFAFVATKAEHVERALNLLGCAEYQVSGGEFAA